MGERCKQAANVLGCKSTWHSCWSWGWRPRPLARWRLCGGRRPWPPPSRPPSPMRALSSAATLATATTCFNPADKAAYWMPTMKWGPRTLQPSYALLYYRAARKAPKQVQPHPPGLKVLTNENSHATWRCLAGKWVTSPPTRCSNGTLVVRIRFPDCSNGKLDSADHRSHMAYAFRQSDGRWRCPTTHKKPVPALSMNVHFPIPTASGKVRLSSGAASTIHADFFNAWDQQK